MPKKRGRAGGRQASAPVKRHKRANVRPSAPVASSDVELWTPPKKVLARLERAAKRAASVPLSTAQSTTGTGVVPVAAGATSFNPNDEVTSEMSNWELGFDRYGRCLFGCDGVRSFKKGYTNVACHDVKCAFWDSLKGVDEMKRLERDPD